MPTDRQSVRSAATEILAKHKFKVTEDAEGRTNVSIDFGGMEPTACVIRALTGWKSDGRARLVADTHGTKFKVLWKGTSQTAWTRAFEVSTASPEGDIIPGRVSVVAKSPVSGARRALMRMLFGELANLERKPMLFESGSDADAEKGSTSPEEAITEAGATIYSPSSAFDARSFAGYPVLQREIESHLLLPLRASALYEQVAQATRGDGALAPVPRALLFAGPPGCGKTLAARAIAASSGVPLVYVGVESITSMWYGQSEKRLAKIFDLTAKLAPAILFLDEIECLAGSRERDLHEASRRILSVLLRKIDGLLGAKGVTVLGATNRREDLDPALASRFAEVLQFPLPDDDDRAAILTRFAQHLPPDEIRALSIATAGQSGRDLRHLCDGTERAWVAELAKSSAARAEPPPVARYLAKAKGGRR